MEFVHPLTSKYIHIETMTLEDISHEQMEKILTIEQTGGAENKPHNAIMPYLVHANCGVT